MFYFIIGTSGSGKSTFAQTAFEPGSEIISTTTRPVREGEISGQHYYFVSPQEFERLEDHNHLLEQTQYSGHSYGITKAELHNKLNTFSDVYAIVDLNGFLQVKPYLVEQSIPYQILWFRTDPKLCIQRIEERHESKEVFQQRIRQLQLDVVRNQVLLNEPHLISMDGSKPLDLLRKEVRNTLSNHMSTTRQRGFELVSYAPESATLPKRSTQKSAGYDFFASETVVIPPIDDIRKPVLVPTHVKAYMLDDEKLDLLNRSSNPIKRQLIVSNGVGLIDADYYNNPDNEGHIMVQFINYGVEDVIIQAGEKICQGVFTKYLKADDDTTVLPTRQGGHGSTGN